MIDPQEADRRRSKLALILEAQEADGERTVELQTVRDNRRREAPEALAILDALAQTGDLVTFKADLDRWSRLPGYRSFGGVNGQMFINQMINASDDADALSALLVECFRPPADLEAARAKINALVTNVELVRKGAHPAPKRVPYVASFFWSLQAHDEWPCMWTSAEKMLVALGWLTIGPDHAENYAAFAEAMRALDDDFVRIEEALSWFERHPFVGLDPSLVTRCTDNIALNQHQSGSGPYEPAESGEAASRNATIVLSELRLLAQHVQENVASAIGRSLVVGQPNVFWREGRYRADAWVALRTGDKNSPALRIWTNRSGVAVGIHPGWLREGWYEEAGGLLNGSVPPGMGFLHLANRTAPDLEARPSHGGGEFLLGRWFPDDSALARADFADDVVAIAADLQPAMDRLLRSGVDSGSEATKEAEPDDELAALVREFLVHRAYPTDKDEFHRAERRRMAEVLSPTELEIMDLGELKVIYNGNRYGAPGPQSVLNRTLNSATPIELEQFAASVRHLLWSEESDDAARIDRVLDIDDLGFKGLGESVVMKFLAIAHPERYVPVYPYQGDMGKVRMLRLLGLEPPAVNLSRGAKQVAANDLIRRRLDPLFPGDPWGQGQFLYWLNTRKAAPDLPEVPDVLAELSADLLVDRGFLDDIVALLRDKGQVIFYGPPGTGKTYLAQRLAAALANDPSRRTLVQFHPSTSYEDFFEGYRPEGADDGQLTYRLTPGPLARLAARAEAAPSVDHVMVIDEINRANLPRVLGELLFLLEYRDHRVMTLYRPEEGFELPPNLYLIGTMNTADRSIALIDAALRRRFHFVPFFPHEGAMAGLLGRWLEKHGGPQWVGDLVEMVNQELIDDLGGPHLQIGPSHFMRPDLTETGLRRIWNFNILPYVEDQLFGQADRIREYEFERALARYRGTTGVEDEPGAVEAASDADLPEL